MKKHWLALALCAFSPRLGAAQDAKTPVVSERVPPSRAMEVATPEAPIILADTDDLVTL